MTTSRTDKATDPAVEAEVDIDGLCSAIKGWLPLELYMATAKAFTALQRRIARLEPDVRTLSELAVGAANRADHAEAERDALKAQWEHACDSLDTMTDACAVAVTRSEKAEADLSALKQRVAELETDADPTLLKLGAAARKQAAAFAAYDAAEDGSAEEARLFQMLEHADEELSRCARAFADAMSQKDRS